MSGGAREGTALASALATLRRVRRRLEREAAREAGFLESSVGRANRAPSQRQIGSPPLPASGRREDR